MNLHLITPIKLLTLGQLQQDKLNEIATALFNDKDIAEMQKNNQQVTWPEIILHKKFFEIIIPEQDKNVVTARILALMYNPNEADQHPVDYVYSLWNQLPF